MFTTRRSSLYSNVTKKVTQARKGLGTNSVGLATELSLVSKLLQKVIPKKISAHRDLRNAPGIYMIAAEARGSVYGLQQSTTVALIVLEKLITRSCSTDFFVFNGWRSASVS